MIYQLIGKIMYSIRKNRILKSLEILSVKLQNFWPEERVLPILLSLYLKMLMIKISTQTNNYKYRKSVTTKKSTLLKKWLWSFEILNLSFYAKRHFFNQVPNLCSLEDNKAVMEQVKVAEKDGYIYASLFQEIKSTYTQLVPKTGYIK